MAIYTSYYAKQAKDFNNGKKIFVRVSTGVPEWFPYDLISLPELYPGWDLVSRIKQGLIDELDYKREYLYTKGQSELYETKSILNRLQSDNPDKDIYLLCYENKDGFCHRHLIGDVLGIRITEAE